MATDFFIQQDKARRRTSLLILLFVLAVLGIILSVYLAAIVTFAAVGYNTSTRAHSYSAVEASFLQPTLFLGIAGVTSAVVGMGSLYKIHQLAAGGEAVALMLGGRPINANSRDLHERRVLNVVEEMAIASGLPVPPVFVIEEKGINAFAAGHRPSDAVIGVTRGTVDLLNRDELQGVIAHEFSHILNGDMRLNLRLIGLIHGIIVISMIGYVILRTVGRSSGRRREKGEGGAVIAVLLFGVALLIIGWIGSLFGQIIRAAVSRQREYLADSSAVQFTRNPDGIAGALKKIGGWAAGSKVEQPHASEVSHMFFSQALTHSFAQMFATHPPLEERIRRLDPQWDGKYPKNVVVESVDEITPSKPAKARRIPIPFPIDLAHLPGRVGELGVAQLAGASAILAEMPQRVTEAAHDPFSAVALVYAMLIDSDPDVERIQWEGLARTVPAPILDETKRLVYYVQSLPRSSRLPAVELVLPTLKSLSKPQYLEFRKNAIALVRADRRVTLFELVLQLFAIRCLDKNFGLPRGAGGMTRGRFPRKEISTVLAFLARAGAADERGALSAYRAGWSAFESASADQMPSPDDSSQSAFLQALDRLESAASELKRKTLAACAACITSDKNVTMDEYELLRAIASVLECPLPPIPEPESSA